MQRIPVYIPALAAALFAGLPASALAARLDFTVDGGIEHNDNVALSPSDPVSQNIRRLGFGFTLSQQSSTIQTEVTGRADYLDYPEIFADTVYGSLAGAFNWAVVPERLHFVAEDVLTVQPVDALVPDAPGNRQQLNVLSVGPTLLFRWTRTLDGAIDARLVDSHAETTDELNSRRYVLGLRALKELDPARRLSFNLQGQKVDFDDDLAARDHDRIDAFARYELMLTNLDLGLDLGWSRLDYDDGEQRDDPLLRTDLGWRPSARSRFTLIAWNQISDAALDSMTGHDLEPGLPVHIPAGVVSLRSSQYEERRVSLGYEYAGARSTVSIEPFAYRQRYVDSSAIDQDGRGIRVALGHQLNATLRFDAGAELTRIEYLTPDRTDRLKRFDVSLRKQWSRHWATRLAWYRDQRTLSVPGLSASRNTVFLSMSYDSR